MRPSPTLRAMTLGLLALSLLRPGIFAQEDAMAPAKEQRRFHRLIGHWKGSGQWRLAPGAPPSKWTTVATAKSVLGGHFVQEDVRIDFGAYAPAPMAIRTWYGYSMESRKWMAFSVNNLGMADAVEVLWEDGKMLTGKAGTERGTLFLERYTRTFEENTYTMKAYRSMGSGKPFAYVDGSFERQPEASPLLGKDATAFIPPAKEMGKVASWAGTYRMKGWVKPAAEASPMELTATETRRSIFGGTALEFVLKGDPNPDLGGFECRGVLVWDGIDRCYKNLILDSSGAAMLQSANWSGDHFVVAASWMQGGVPVAARTTIACGKDGAPKSVTEHKTVGAAAPLHTFQASYDEK